MPKLLLLDIDGTLLDSNKKLPASAKEALQQARLNGHDLAIATGRGPFMITSILEELKIDTYITFNGQYISHNNKVVHKQVIEAKMLNEILAYAEQRNHPVVFMNEEKMVSSIDFHPDIEESIQTLKIPHPETEKDFHLNHEVYQALVFCEKEEEQQYHDAFKEVDFVRWHRVSCDISPKGGTKASGIKKLIRATGHSIEDTIAFGDGLNDLDMMDVAGYSVAMANGHEETKKRASYVTEHVDNDGLAKAFKHLKLI
ncbi:Cof-type HAD-IIB family hydrolase [Planococcus sp. S3-L1]|uniref:Cof-type HAD-IIB family hydrolase n=1 Tax=Planococcus sp. S3-L1 TaxID=3046200 RepID=UPI0024B8EEEB|nr:Cof-type HAD-IIB family hydrolase [Planococcus sp. S3-L1]MDJ0330683.1 Cof-type HAD-IIB family hydrolase [Planococcus sp. S3-L1]